eukprot:CAMPEP_0185415660 /NCGR_PEP_ID=MMETSP1365-20130426/6666_1 /TAXON_ID=38817 /ORGANISM="Gephyrocapsa oceanica, Strain RCC1303" /LENGTH=94 /DNA_ID=CAMNT_0028018785 /DNA_START=55 /DNA_END=340 /DNA_ORIENTATION=-
MKLVAVVHVAPPTSMPPPYCASWGGQACAGKASAREREGWQALSGPMDKSLGAAARAANEGASHGRGGEGAAGSVSNRRRGGLGVQLAAAEAVR